MTLQNNMCSKLLLNILPLLLTVISFHSSVQDKKGTLTPKATLDDVIAFALDNRVPLQQAIIDEEIGEREIASALSGWFPQINGTGTYNNNIIIPTAVIGDQIIRMGQPHVSAFVLQADQFF